MRISRKVSSITLVLGATSSLLAPACFAEDGDGSGRACVDWKKLSLSSAQNQQVQALETDWNNKYMKIQPEILTEQKKLAKLLMEPKSDPLEIMATNQRIAHLKEQLRNEAITNHLKKRAILNADQQHQLEAMMQQMIATRQQTLAPPVPQTGEQGGFMDLIQKVNWAINGDKATPVKH